MQLTGVEGQTDGKLCSSGEGGADGKDLPVCTCMCGSACAWSMLRMRAKGNKLKSHTVIIEVGTGGPGGSVPPQYFRRGPDPPNNYPATCLIQLHDLQ